MHKLLFKLEACLPSRAPCWSMALPRSLCESVSSSPVFPRQQTVRGEYSSLSEKRWREQSTGVESDPVCRISGQELALLSLPVSAIRFLSAARVCSCLLLLQSLSSGIFRMGLEQAPVFYPSTGRGCK